MSEKKTPADSKVIDWNDIHRRVERFRETIDADWQLEPARVEAILRERAQKLAQPIASAIATQQLDLLEFILAEEHYGIAADYVREVFPLADFTPVPCTPAFVLGIVNLRGEMISLIDIRRYFGLAPTGITDLNKVIVVEGHRLTFGIVVDDIAGVSSLTLSELLPATEISGVSAPYLLGVTPQRMAVIDTEKLLRDGHIVVDETVGYS